MARRGIQPRILECGVCFGEYKDPRYLPCRHSFCSECLSKHVSTMKTADGTFRCPQCRVEFTAPGQNVNSFPRNLRVDKLKDVLESSVLQKLSQVRITRYTAPNCRRHRKTEINLYCHTCSAPVCSDCRDDEHNGHDIEDLNTVAGSFKRNLANVSKMCSERIDNLKETSAGVDKASVRMEKDFDRVSQNIRDACIDIRATDYNTDPIKQHEQSLQNQLDQARRFATEQNVKITEEIGIAIDNASKLVSSADSSLKHDVALCTVLDALDIKELFLGQGDVPVPLIDCTIIQQDVKPSDLISTANFVGDVQTSTSVVRQRSVKTETCNLEAPVEAIKLDYKGERAVCGIAPIHKTMVCVAFCQEPYICVYSNTGQLVRNVAIPEIKRIFGMVTVAKREGKIAIVQYGNQVHFVTLSERLEVEHTTKDVPVDPGGIGINPNKELTVQNPFFKQVVSLSPDGDVLSNTKLNVPTNLFIIESIAKTPSWFVISDSDNQQVYFTDTLGHIVHTSVEGIIPCCIIQTSWGHVLIAYPGAHEIKAFSEHGDSLGNVHDTDGSIPCPSHMHIDEQEGLLFVACGSVAERELRIYKFAPSDFPCLPVQRLITKLTVNVKLTKT